MDIDGSQTIDAKELRQCLFLLGMEEHIDMEEKIDELLVLYDSTKDGKGEIDLAGWLRLMAPLLTMKGKARERIWQLKLLILSWIVVILYLFIGAYTMYHLESDPEEADLEHWDYLLARHAEAYNTTQEMHISEIVGHLTHRSICTIPECATYEARYEGDMFRCQKYHRTWDLNSAMFFCWTVITTIGFGSFTPMTWKGKSFTIGYSLPGLILVGYALSGLIDLPGILATYYRIYTGTALSPLEEIFAREGNSEEDAISLDEGEGMVRAVKPGRKKRRKMKRGQKNSKESAVDAMKEQLRSLRDPSISKSIQKNNAAGVKSKTPDTDLNKESEKISCMSMLEILQSYAPNENQTWFLMMIGYVVAFSLVLTATSLEEWSFFEGCYFAWITFTTIGIGDYVVGNDNFIYFVIMSVPGLALVSKFLGDCDDMMGGLAHRLTFQLNMRLLTVRGEDHALDDSRATVIELAEHDIPAAAHERLPKALNTIVQSHNNVAMVLTDLVGDDQDEDADSPENRSEIREKVKRKSLHMIRKSQDILSERRRLNEGTRKASTGEGQELSTSATEMCNDSASIRVGETRVLSTEEIIETPLDKIRGISVSRATHSPEGSNNLNKVLNFSTLSAFIPTMEASSPVIPGASAALGDTSRFARESLEDVENLAGNLMSSFSGPWGKTPGSSI